MQYVFARFKAGDCTELVILEREGSFHVGYDGIVVAMDVCLHYIMAERIQ